jgi:hypothetical protein
MGKIKDAMPKKHEPEKNACQRAWYKIIFFERKQGVQRHTPWEKKGYTCTRKKGENKPILSEPLLEIREMIITQKEFKKNHSNLRVWRFPPWSSRFGLTHTR